MSDLDHNCLRMQPPIAATRTTSGWQKWATSKAKEVQHG